jgi:hypothetical protein
MWLGAIATGRGWRSNDLQAAFFGSVAEINFCGVTSRAVSAYD